MKICKTSYRNKLRASTMSQLMTIKLHAEEISKFDPQPALHHWNKSGKRARRPNVMDTEKLPPANESVAGDSFSDSESDNVAAAVDSVCDPLDESDSDYNSDADYSDDPDSQHYLSEID